MCGLEVEAVEALEVASTLLDRAQQILFITGAGVSAESGLPTYRGVSGLYNRGPAEDDLSIEEILSGPVFAERPGLTWKYLLEIENSLRDASPNRAHQIIAALEKDKDRVVTLTQNVDGLHRAAGQDNVIDIHGDVHTLLCTACPWTKRVRDYAHLRALPPRCDSCDSVIRPDVVFFEEALPPAKMERYREALTLGFELIFTVGTSSLFSYIVDPIVAAAEVGLPTIEINPDRTMVSDAVTVKLGLGAVEALEAIYRPAST